MYGDDAWLQALMRRVKGAGYALVALTVDLAYYGNRERVNPQQMALRDLTDRDWQKTVTWETVKMLKDTLGDSPVHAQGHPDRRGCVGGRRAWRRGDLHLQPWWVAKPKL